MASHLTDINRYSQFAVRYQSADCDQSGLFTHNKTPLRALLLSRVVIARCSERTTPPSPPSTQQISVLIKMISEFQILFFPPLPSNLSKMLIKQASLNHISLLRWILLRGQKV